MTCSLCLALNGDKVFKKPCDTFKCGSNAECGDEYGYPYCKCIENYVGVSSVILILKCFNLIFFFQWLRIPPKVAFKIHARHRRLVDSMQLVCSNMVKFFANVVRE